MSDDRHELSGAIHKLRAAVERIQQLMAKMYGEQQRATGSVVEGIRATQERIVEQTKALGEMEILLREADLRAVLELLGDQEKRVEEWVQEDLRGIREIEELYDEHLQEIEERRNQQVYDLLKPAFQLWGTRLAALARAKMGGELHRAGVRETSSGMALREAALGHLAEEAKGRLAPISEQRRRVERVIADQAQERAGIEGAALLSLPVYVVRTETTRGDVDLEVFLPRPRGKETAAWGRWAESVKQLAWKLVEEHADEVFADDEVMEEGADVAVREGNPVYRFFVRRMLGKARFRARKTAKGGHGLVDLLPGGKMEKPPAGPRPVASGADEGPVSSTGASAGSETGRREGPGQVEGEAGSTGREETGPNEAPESGTGELARAVALMRKGRWGDAAEVLERLEENDDAVFVYRQLCAWMLEQANGKGMDR